MAAAAAAEDHPVRDLQSMPPLFFTEGVRDRHRARSGITDFRDADGVVDPDAAHRRRDLGAVRPRPARSDPGRRRPAPAGRLRPRPARQQGDDDWSWRPPTPPQGLATIGIDVPNHGGRQAGQGGYLLDLTVAGTPGPARGDAPAGHRRPRVAGQGGRSHHLGGLDRAPWRPFGAHGDGVAGPRPVAAALPGDLHGRRPRRGASSP